MNKIPFMYKTARAILGPIFNWYYKPTIINAENIPEEGNILIVGNHVHLYDQCLTIIATKRGISYMAKKEYFDNKKVAWFFKSCGCISVDRSKKDTEATQSALNELESGSAVGLFPEGTRNGLKDEKIIEIYDDIYDEAIDYKAFKKMLKKQNPKTSRVNLLITLYKENKITKEELKKYLYNVDESLKTLIKEKKLTQKEFDESILLPFKFGAVSMAKKTDSYLVPFGITGDYKFRSTNLTIRYGKPFKVGDMDLEEANEKLFQEIKHLMEQNMKEENKK